MNYEILWNVILGVFIYEVIKYAIKSIVFKWLLNSDSFKEQRKSFKEKLEEKLKEE